MKLITFSLWGDNPMYTVGAIKNAEIAKELFPDWVCRFYIADTVPKEIIEELENLDSEIVRKSDSGSSNCMFWRFEPAADGTVEAMIVRDTDSRLGIREKSAVDEWLRSNKKVHIMRDHPYHQAPMLGGMWGCKPILIDDMDNLIKQHLSTNENKKGSDQHFLWSIFPKFIDDIYVHDPFFDKNPFPMERKEDPVVRFIGQVFDENDNYSGNWKSDLEILEKHEN
jgi:hypothetical protein